MSQTATIVPLTAKPPSVEPAIVAGPSDAKGYLRVSLSGDTVERRVRVAVYPRPRLAPGDEVLITTDGRGRAYIVGVLSCTHDVPSPIDRIRLTDGAEARLERSSTHESLKLYSSRNELLVDYRSRSGTVIVNAASGNLEFTATQGGIAFHSAKDIHINGNRVALNAASDIHLGVQSANGDAGPAVAMNQKTMKLTAPVLGLIARRADLFVEETQIAGKKLLGRIADVQLIARKIESVAETVMAKAKNVYRSIAELSQLKAGRQRTLIETTIHTKARKTILKSEQDFKVKAEKIHLG